MLSSTADHLFWLGRSVERAENMARMLDVTQRMSLVKHAGDQSFQEWGAVLSSSGMYTEFLDRYEFVTADNVLNFMGMDLTNPSSIVGCLSTARESARAVRGTISSEMWEALNHTYLEVRERTRSGISPARASAFFDWIKERSHLSRGITLGTMLQDDAFRFMRMGTFLERSDNTARILDVKYHILLPSLADVGGAADYYQWGALLRSLSGFEAYRKVYRDAITPRRVAEMLIFREGVPRSLRHCIAEVNRLVQLLDSSSRSELVRRCGRLDAELRFGTIEDVFQVGLHEYLTGVLARINSVGDAINSRFFWPSQES